MSNPYHQLRQDLNRPLFIPFMVVGDPDKDRSIDMIEAIIIGGADALELGFPFSDPSADGPVIQAADKRALDAGVKIDDCFAIIAEVCRRRGFRTVPPAEVCRRRGFRTAPPADYLLPIGLLVYYNLVLQRGIDQFYADCAASGVTSVLIADLPIEHADDVIKASKAHDIQQVFMVSELSTDERIKEVCAKADGYIYVVSYCGVTGVQDAVMEEKVASTIKRVRNHTNLPLVVGFGINTPEQVKAVADAGADGVIVASRLVQEVPDTKKIQMLCRALGRGV